MTPTMITTAVWILSLSFCILLILRFPVALVLAMSSLFTYLYMTMANPFEDKLINVVQQMLQGTNIFSLLAIPFFILAGQILGAGGLANRIVNFANLFFGRLPGGLSIVNSVACMLFGNLSGSAIADTSAVGSVMIPIMKQKGYTPEYAVGVTISSAIQGVVVPPSHNLVLYSIAAVGTLSGIRMSVMSNDPAHVMLSSDPYVTNAIAQGITAKPMALSITDLFLAGILPGFLLLATLITVGLIISIRNKYPKGDPVIAREIPMTIFHGLLSLSPAMIILGSIVFGWATATEAGALAVVYSFFLATVVYRELTIKKMWPVLVRTFRTVLMVFFLIGASASFGYVMSELHLPELITKWVLSISNSPIVILMLINVLLLILGGPMDMAPMILILTPILLPVCMNLDMNTSLPGVQGMHPIQFGLVLIFNAGMGLLTPPVGTVLFVGCAIGKVSVNAGTKAMMPFFIAMIVALLLITYIPSISMWLPTEFPKWFPVVALN